MKRYSVTLPLIGLVTGTRAMAASGLALVLAEKLSRDQRKAIGWTLLGIGIVSTIPLAAMLFGCGEKTSKPAE
jgi:hypothetical protein